MRFRCRVAVTVTALGCPACSSAGSADTLSAAVYNRTDGGVDLPAANLPAVGRLYARSLIATATLIDDHHVLTAGHAVDFSGGSVAVHAYERFELTVVSPPGHSATMTVPVAYYRSLSMVAGKGDLALVRLRSSVPSIVAKPVRLSMTYAELPVRVRMYGMGGGSRASGCRQAGEGALGFSAVEFLWSPKWNTTYTHDAVGACDGDSGGPTVTSDGSRLLAVHSATDASLSVHEADVVSARRSILSLRRQWDEFARVPDRARAFGLTTPNLAQYCASFDGMAASCAPPSPCAYMPTSGECVPARAPDSPPFSVSSCSDDNGRPGRCSVRAPACVYRECTHECLPATPAPDVSCEPSGVTCWGINSTESLSARRDLCDMHPSECRYFSCNESCGSADWDNACVCGRRTDCLGPTPEAPTSL